MNPRRNSNRSRPRATAGREERIPCATRPLQAGDELVQPANTQHDLTAGDDEVIYVARAMNGIEVSGQPS